MLPLIPFFAFAVAQAADSPSMVQAVCVSQGCLIGNSSLYAGATLTLDDASANASIRSVALLPGTYDLSTSNLLGNTSNTTTPLSSFAASSPSALPGFTSSGSLSSNLSVALNSSVALLSYPQSFFSGSPALTSGRTASLNAGSLFLPPRVFAILRVSALKGDPQQVTLYDSVADSKQWSFKPSNDGSITLVDLQSSTCKTPCASSGACSANGTCVCDPGFTGPACNTCLPGFFGPLCQPCSCSSGSACSDGITGSGLCTTQANATTALDTCNCLNGVCSSSSSCSCNAGWADDPNGGARCSVCASGFAQSSSGDCLACMPGCTSCNSSRCLSCSSGLQISASTAQTCEPVPFSPDNSTFSSCGDGAFNNNGTCSACNALCATCFGPSASQCLRCASPRVLLNGQCVNMDSSTGVCDKSSAGIDQNGANAVFIMDNSKGECDAAPAKCTAATIPSFSVTSSRSNIQCSACLAGTSLATNNTCVAHCPSNQFASAGSNSVCTPCNSGCATCSSADVCTSCPSGSLLSNSTCVSSSSCGNGFFSSDGACLACSQECASCSDRFDQCTSCPAARPILTSNNTCVSTCPKGQFANGSTCQACSSSCLTCFGPSEDQCLSCDAKSILAAGKCAPANCTAGLDPVASFGVCLESLVQIASEQDAVTSSSKKTKSLLVPLLSSLLGSLLLLSVLLVSLRYYCRNKRKAKTQRFEDKKELGEQSMDKKKRRFFDFFKRKEEWDTKPKSNTYTMANRDKFIKSISAPIQQQQTPLRPPRSPATTIGSHYTESTQSNRDPFYLEPVPSNGTLRNNNPFLPSLEQSSSKRELSRIPSWPPMPPDNDVQDVPSSPSTTVYSVRQGRRPETLFTITSPHSQGTNEQTYPLFVQGSKH